MRKNQPFPLVPMNPADAFDVWKTGVTAFELWATALSTIGQRQTLWSTQAPSDAKMIRENQRMVTEKLEACMEIGFEMQKAMLSMATGQFSPWWITSQRTMKTMHRRTTANSRRLSKSR
ncbi:hypothetical protein [Modicisalibacter zincidurans]|uniref:Phasin domain-containing protein n=1 Tax=Modicisalibacter zincidurans TaxID=1178777 RepID=A0ABP9REH5_9GAMM|nr:hypothetical protein [Halomonas zincidurans]